MNKGLIFSLIGLIMFMSGIYLSTKWAIVGTIMGISGGLLLGVSTYFRAMQDDTKKVSK